MNDKTFIRWKKGTTLRNPILIAGLPGIGSVGRLVAEHLRKEFNAERFATLYSSHFPHQVIMLKSGRMRLVSNRFYIIRSKRGSGSDIVVLTGDTQAVTPEGQYEVNTRVIEFFKEKLKGKFVYTVGGYAVGEGLVKSPRVFGSATSQDVIDQFKGTGVIFGKSKGVILGSAGLLVAFAKMYNLDGICVMGETSLLDVDAGAAKAVIMMLSKRLNLEIDTSRLDKIISNTTRLVKELEGRAGTDMPLPLGGEPGTEGERPSYIR